MIRQPQVVWWSGATGYENEIQNGAMALGTESFLIGSTGISVIAMTTAIRSVLFTYESATMITAAFLHIVIV